MEVHDSLIIRIRVHDIWCIYGHRNISFFSGRGTASGKLGMKRNDLATICGHTPDQLSSEFVQQGELREIALPDDQSYEHNAQQRPTMRLTW